jgi:hypothetical protein
VTTFTIKSSRAIIRIIIAAQGSDNKDYYRCPGQDWKNSSKEILYHTDTSFEEYLHPNQQKTFLRCIKYLSEIAHYFHCITLFIKSQ